MSEADLREALRAFVRGEVRRVRLGLRGASGEDLRPLFETVAIEEGYRWGTVADALPAAGRRVPAFVLEGDDVLFGWVFEERFDERRSRHLFASVERERDGSQHDWLVVLGRNSKRSLLYRPEGAEPYDPERPDLF